MISISSNCIDLFPCKLYTSGGNINEETFNVYQNVYVKYILILSITKYHHTAGIIHAT